MPEYPDNPSSDTPESLPLVGEPPSKLELEKSLMFFHAYMYGPLQGKLRLYESRGVRPGNATTSSDWEVFASMLVNDLGTKAGSGIDLSQFEVKSAISGSSFEYQYHKETGKQKLKKDMAVGHLFFSHEDNLRHVEVRYVHGVSAKKDFFAQWLADYPDPYPQRYRKSIPYGWVKENGKLLVVLKDGEVVRTK